MLRACAPAKVNLFLGVGPARPDGYHSVTTVLHTLSLHDTLIAHPSDTLSVECVPDLRIPVEQNLVFRAAVAMGRAFGIEPAVRIELHKHVPHGAGLGGGSSDAAAVVAMLAHLWGIDPSSDDCRTVAASLGADVPFFLGPTGAALMTGRGDEIAESLPALEGTPVLLLKPPQAVSTSAAYAAFDTAPSTPGDHALAVRALQAGDVAALAASLDNNMASASARVVPAVADALAWVREALGVRGATVAGSGSAVFGICDSVESANAAAAAAATESGWWTAVTALAGSGVTIDDEGGVR